MTQDCRRFPRKCMIPSSLLPRSRNKNGPTREKNIKIFHQNIQSPLNIADQLNTWEKHAFAILIILCFHTRAPPSYMDLFRTKEMRVITILITILWMLIRSISTKRYFWNSQYSVFSLEFDCTVRNITNLDFSIYVSFCVSFSSQIMSNYEDNNDFKQRIQISAALEFPADLLSIVGLEWLGRRFFDMLISIFKLQGRRWKTFNPSTKSSFVPGGQLPSPCWPLVWPSYPVPGLPTNPCPRLSLPWLGDSLPPMPWTLDSNSLLRWFDQN